MSNHGAGILVAAEATGRRIATGIGNERATKPGAKSPNRSCSGYAFTWPCLLLCGLILAGWQCAHGAPPVLRLAGSFMQFQDEMKSWEPGVWRQILDRMKELEMDTVIVQMLAEENADGTTNSFIGPSGSEDATEAILNYADTNGFKVFLGLYMHQYHDLSDTNFLSKALADNVGVAQQAWQRYMQPRRHNSFAGWYAPLEPWTAAWPTAQINALRSFYKGVHDACRLLSGDAPMAIAPAISADRPPPCEVQQVYLQLLAGSGVDIVLLQDSVGAQQWNSDIVSHDAPYFAAFQAACQTRGVQLWADTECFLITPTNWLACDAARLKQQLAATAPFVQEFVTFDFLNYMNPAAFLSTWNQARRASMLKLFADYKAQLVSTDYAPLAPPRISASWSSNAPALNWNGAAGDQFQVQFKANLEDSAWTPLAAAVLTNGEAFSIVDAGAPAQGCRYYRVQRLPRLQVPDSMVWVPPGDFLMGTPASDSTRTTDPLDTQAELPQFQVALTRGFWMSRFELTQWEYQDIMCGNPSAFGDDLGNPVESVTWTQAEYYCARLTQREQQAGRLPVDYVYRLPTEAEWEYVARAGTTGWFSFGDDLALLHSYGWYNADSGSNPHPTGQLLPNPWGLSDLHGNMFEWCWDWIAAPPAGPVTDFIGQTNGSLHAIRGGAWNSSWVDCRSSWRTGHVPTYANSALGLRVVLAPVP